MEVKQDVFLWQSTIGRVFNVFSLCVIDYWIISENEKWEKITEGFLQGHFT